MGEEKSEERESGKVKIWAMKAISMHDVPHLSTLYNK